MLRRKAAAIASCDSTAPNSTTTPQANPNRMDPKHKKETTARPGSPEKRASQLKETLNRASHEYYVLDSPKLSDREYDKLFRELQDLESQYPDLRTPDSPTVRVGAAIQSSLAKHQHLVAMVSLGNAFDDSELAAWEERSVRLAGKDVEKSG